MFIPRDPAFQNVPVFLTNKGIGYVDAHVYYFKHDVVFIVAFCSVEIGIAV